MSFSRDFRPFKPTAKYDIDGDGVEDNMKLDSEELDKFYLPNVYGAPIEHIYNTRHGELPDHNQVEFDAKLTAPEGDDYTLVRKPWAAKGDTPPKPALPENEDSLESYLESIEKNVIVDALETTRWNKTAAAKKLGITFRALRYRLKKLGLE